MKNSTKKVTVIGAGLAGSEAAFQLASRGIEVHLIEMKPAKKSPAHSADFFAELVCSNSLRSDDIGSASGLLKHEMRRLNSLMLNSADRTRVAAGGALAVDRNKFGELITNTLKSTKNIKVSCHEQTEIDLSQPTVIATGPLTSDSLSNHIGSIIGKESLHFFDAAAPIVSADSIDMSHAFIQDRYDKGDGTGDYINCPMSKDEYNEFYTELINAKTAEVKDFEKGKVFEGCVPIEVLAARGQQTMRFGPLKPVGLFDPAENRRPYAVVQLRKETNSGEMYNLVGFQTRLTWGEQKRVFSLIPALKNAQFLRYGVMHKNTFINSPMLLTKTYALKSHPNIFFAGQITGVEGYIESASSGMLAALNMYNFLCDSPPINYEPDTAITALACYVATENACFQPMNINYGIFSPLDEQTKDKALRKAEYQKRAARQFDKYFSVFMH